MQLGEVRVGHKLKRVSGAEKGWSWYEYGQSQPEGGCVWPETLSHNPSALTGASSIRCDQRRSGCLLKGEGFVPNMNTSCAHGNYCPCNRYTERIS